MKLPASLAAERQGAVAILRLTRPQKRNALDDETILGIETFFTRSPDGIGAVLLHGEGEHFSAGLDLSELQGTRRHAGHRAFRAVASRLRENPVRQGAGGRGAARRGGRRRAGARRGRACARRRELGLLRAAGRQPRHLCRRRRLGAAAATDRRRAHDGHDAHRSHLFRRGRPGHGADDLSGRAGQGLRQRP